MGLNDAETLVNPYTKEEEGRGGGGKRKGKEEVKTLTHTIRKMN